MEDARKASLWAQQLGVRCDLLCNQSAEGTSKMQLDVNRCLELRIKEEEFWIAELQGRKVGVQKLIDDMRALERRLERAVSVVENFWDANQECIKQRAFLGLDVINEHLQEESRMLRNVRDIIENTVQQTMEFQARHLAIFAALEDDVGSKQEAMKTDKLSLDLSKRAITNQHASTPFADQSTNSSPISSSGGRGGGGGRRQNNVMEDSRRDTAKAPWKTDRVIPSDFKLELADEQMRLCELHLEKSAVFLRTKAELIASETAVLTKAMREHCGHLQQEKNDLQQHLDMTNVNLEVADETLHRLAIAIADKERAISVALHRLQLHRARPPSELQHADKDIWIVLERELAASRKELEELLDQVPAIEASQRALRRARLQMAKDVQERILLIKMEELECLAVRDAQMNSINL